ncbi:hypothetical protein FO519_004475 [Halicephalobus sp. NKZ332]|nr:hypothetical protein FO519_004475 [Halicephalobus sp. NKZ332]
MRRKPLRESALHVPCRRRLFADSESSDDIIERLGADHNQRMDRLIQQWGFDFRNDRPLSSGNFAYEKVDPESVPLVYRPNVISRTHVPGIGSVETKTYIHGRGPMPPSPIVKKKPEECPTATTSNSNLPESVVMEVPESPCKPAKYRPYPVTSPMVLRSRDVVYRTPTSKATVQLSAKRRVLSQYSKDILGIFLLCVGAYIDVNVDIAIDITMSNSLSLFQATAYCLGDIVGSGIFISPTAILKNAESSCEKISLGGIVLSTYNGLYSYNGWSLLTIGIEEVQNPKKTLPIATFGGLFLATVIYLLMNTAYFLTLSIDEFKSSETVAVLFLKKAISPEISKIVPFLICIVLIGSLNATFFGSSRYIYAGSKAGIMPSIFSGIHKSSGSPRAAVLFQFFLTVGISFVGNLEDLINYASYAISLQQFTILLALFYMKFKKLQKNREDILKSPFLIPVIYFGVCLGLLIIPVLPETGDFKVGIYAICLLLIGLIIHMTVIRPRKLPGILRKIDPCVDKINSNTGTSDCPSVAGLCNNTAYYDLMTQQCPYTCGRCPTTCVDKLDPSTGISDCSSIVQYCNNATYYDVMTQQCPYTCGRC